MVLQFIKRRLPTVITLLLLAFLVTWGIVSVNNSKKAGMTSELSSYSPPEANVNPDDDGSYEDVAKSGNLTLRYNESKGAVQVVDSSNGYTWKSIVDDDVYATAELNRQWASYLKSILTVSYNNMLKRDSPSAKIFSNSDCNYLETEYLENGVSVKYGFLTQGFFITVEYTLEDGVFVVRVPSDKVYEYSGFAITTIELLPFFGAAGDEINGYMLYPDGSGGITRYEEADSRPSNVRVGSWSVYSNKKADIVTFLTPDLYERGTATMPIYGIKNNDNAFLAALTDGEEEAGIAAYPSGYVVRLNHIGFELHMRNIFDVNMSNISLDASTTAGKIVQRVDKELIGRDYEVKFFMLSGEDANYSKMAEVYRNYLLAAGQLTQSSDMSGDWPLALDITMGATQPQMLFDSYISMTSFEQLTEIFERLKIAGVDDAKAVLSGWLKGASNKPRYWPPASQLGSEGGMRLLNEYLAQNQGFDVFFENDFILAEDGNGGFSTISDVVYNGANIPVTAGLDTTIYLLNPSVSVKHNSDFLEKLLPYRSLNVAYENEGRIVYPDYNERSPFTKRETVDAWEHMFSESYAAGKRVAVAGLNQYAAVHADYLYDVPLGAFGLSITDNSVPFAQMVISGILPYSSSAGNLSYDLDVQKLQWIEYGALPFFRVTYEDSIKLKDTENNSLFTSAYDAWESRIIDVYNEFNNNLSSVYGRRMVSHEVLERDFVKVVYDNGTAIYINYSTSAKSFGKVSVPARDYEMVMEGV
jgi:hypothetical protein